MKYLLEEIKKKNFLVIGDLMLDHYLWGDATRISPEAPVPVVKADRDSFTAGGAANVALNLRAIGANVELVGSLGRDVSGRLLGDILRSAGIGFGDDLAIAGVDTIEKTRVMCRNQQLCRIDREGAPSQYGLSDDFVNGALAGKIAASDAVLISDYAKGVVTPQLIRKIQEIAGKDKLISLDPKPRSGLSFSGLGLITPNRIEAFQLANLSVPSSNEPLPLELLCERLDELYKTELLVITLGADGMLLSREGHPLCQIPTAARQVFDVSGAGDTVNAVLTAALAAGATPQKAAELANHAAGVVVEKLGTATASPGEILAHAGLTL